MLAFGKQRPGQQQGLGQEQLAQAIVSGLHEPVATIPLGLGKDLAACVTTGGQLYDKVHAELLSSGVDPEAAKIAAAAINNDDMLLPAAKASCGWKLGPGSVTSLAWREAIRRARIWFVEVVVYRLLAKHGIRPPNVTGPSAVLAKLPILGPASIQEGMPGHITAAEHLASVLACTGTAFLPFGKYADLMSTCRSSNAGSMVACVAGVQVHIVNQRYRKPTAPRPIDVQKETVTMQEETGSLSATATATAPATAPTLNGAHAGKSLGSSKKRGRATTLGAADSGQHKRVRQDSLPGLFQSRYLLVKCTNNDRVIARL